MESQVRIGFVIHTAVQTGLRLIIAGPVLSNLIPVNILEVEEFQAVSIQKREAEYVVQLTNQTLARSTVTDLLQEVRFEGVVI